MQAMNGSAHLRARLIGCCMALALVASALLFTPVASAAVKPEVKTYLALGDSLAFGYTEEKFDVNFPNESPSFFETGYVNAFAKDLKIKNLTIVNDGCPGETSEGLIGENPELGGAASTEGPSEKLENPAAKKSKEYQGPGDRHPCRYHYVNQLPLHNGGYYNPETGKPVSQLEEAVSTIKAKAHPIEAISLNIGANDELAAVAKCEYEVVKEIYEEKGYSEYSEEPTTTNAKVAVQFCLVFQALDPQGPEYHGKKSEKTFEKIDNNVKDVVDVLQGVGYPGSKIYVQGYYNSNSFVLPTSDGLQKILDERTEKVVHENGAKYGSPFLKINTAVEGSKTEEKNVGCSETLVEKGQCKTAQEGKDVEEGNPYDIAVNKKHAEEKGEEYNGEGDIHPTPAGAKLLGKILSEAS